MTGHATRRATAAMAETAKAFLEEAILDGQLPPGSRINADEIARRCAISHIPVREALRALEAEGWVTHRQHQGASVRTRDPGDLADLFEARVLVEVRVAGLAAKRRSLDDLRAMRALVVRQAETADPYGLAHVNYDFHVAVARCAHNETLTAVVAALNKRARFYYSPTAAARREKSLADHRAIADLIELRSGGDVEGVVRAHIEETLADADAALRRGPPSSSTLGARETDRPRIL